MTPFGSDWRVVEGAVSAWFDAPSLVVGASLAGRVLGLSPGITVDVRSTGVRVRLDTDEGADVVSAHARDLGLSADPTALQQVGVVIESVRPTVVRPFWREVLGDTASERDDPGTAIGSAPSVHVRETSDPRPLRSRFHLDVVRPPSVLERIGRGAGSGPYGVCHRDPDGNDVDLVPGDPLGGGSSTADWQVVFGATASYRTGSGAQRRELVEAASDLSDAAGFPLLIGVRRDLVVFETGKDRWDPDAHGLAVDVGELAASIQTAARDLGAVADPSLARFVQIGLDAADIEAVRSFWVAALGYVRDRRAGLTDIHDPRWSDPVLFFQGIDATDIERRRQRNRIHLELVVAPETAPVRVAAAIAAGGRVIDESDGRHWLADPEGNELVIIPGSW